MSLDTSDSIFHYLYECGASRCLPSHCRSRVASYTVRPYTVRQCNRLYAFRSTDDVSSQIN